MRGAWLGTTPILMMVLLAQAEETPLAPGKIFDVIFKLACPLMNKVHCVPFP